MTVNFNKNILKSNIVEQIRWKMNRFNSHFEISRILRKNIPVETSFQITRDNSTKALDKPLHI